MNRYIHDQCGDLNVCSDGDYVLYTDHLAVVAEKDRDYGKIFHLQLDVIKEKDQYIKELVRLCLSNGIISRGLACEHLGCAREDLDDVIKEDSDGLQTAEGAKDSVYDG